MARRWSQIASCAFLVGLSVSLVSAKPPRYRMEDLPEFCPFTQDADYPNRAPFERIYGAGPFSAMHHYCRGLRAMIDLGEIDEAVIVRGKYRQAISDFDYLLDRIPRNYFLRPEILVTKASAFLGLQQDFAAVECFQEAIQIQPDYVPAYIGLANYFGSVDDPDSVQYVIDMGLRYAPDHPALLERRRLLPATE